MFPGIRLTFSDFDVESHWLGMNGRRLTWTEQKLTKYHIEVSFLFHGLFTCAACIYAYWLVSIPTSFKGRNDEQKQSKCKLLMLFLDKNAMLFRMVHLVLLEAESYMLKIEVEQTQFSWIVLSIFDTWLDLQQKQLRHWKEHQTLV